MQRQLPGMHFFAGRHRPACVPGPDRFHPTAEEIAQVGLEHIRQVPKAVVSFGQGCEGEPLTAHNVIVPAVQMIREHTDQGTINLNTNASLPGQVNTLCRAGLDSMRVSMNSVQKTPIPPISGRSPIIGKMS